MKIVLKYEQFVALGVLLLATVVSMCKNHSKTYLTTGLAFFSKLKLLSKFLAMCAEFSGYTHQHICTHYKSHLHSCRHCYKHAEKSHIPNEDET